MKHGRKIVKLQRKQDHRDALLMNLTCSLIEHRRIRTTLAKAKALRPFAEKLVTLGKRGTLHARRTALSTLRHKDMVKKLFEEIAVASKDRVGGYTRITKLGQRRTDSAPMAYIEWVDAFVPKAAEAPAAEAAAEPAAEEAAAPKKKAPAKKKAAAKKAAAAE
ncbi:MAG: 50S ribosomal protein L17 [Prosthecobacter sp.]|jgi:large subunit ribosomal protein L17|uniref:50S ribosomal protein L17 n=1 Tax=Prosthecobacter sp. TaxID=1965333 RepID=UPI0019F17504|nr:50S ribosomal protein L17 [Prosthecobacter sp.]MBE2282676.1 50S ribosomal protein L17 [Prosthecobacter sp.]